MAPKLFATGAEFRAALTAATNADFQNARATQDLVQDNETVGQDLVPESNEIQGSVDASSDTSYLECVQVDFVGHTFEYDKELMEDHFGMVFSKDVWSEIKSKIITGVIDLDSCELGSKRVAWLHGFLPRFDLF